MRVTKFTHACLLVEIESKKVLIDPGEFTWNAGDLTDKVITALDYCVVTHEHFDHFNETALKQIKQKSPQVIFMGGPAVVKKFSQIGIDASSKENELISFDVGEHAHLWTGQPIFENSKVTIGGKLLHLGDSMDASSSPAVLAVPIFGPWEGGTITDAINVARNLKPAYVIPIHDWHYNSEARSGFLQRMQEALGSDGIQVIGTELSKTYDIKL